MYLTQLNRNQLLTHLQKKGKVAEVGVNNGGFASYIEKLTTPAKLHLIDPWGGPEDEYVRTYGVKEDMGEKFVAVSKLFAAQIAKGTVVMHREYSVPAAKQFADGYFDWVYIDAMHTYEGVRDDLAAFDSKVKEDGFIFGHDFNNNPRTRAKKFGVMQAVTEFVQKRGYSILFVTLEAAASYVIAKDPNGKAAHDFVDSVIGAEPRLVEIDDDMVYQFDQVERVLPDKRRIYVSRISKKAPSFITK